MNESAFPWSVDDGQKIIGNKGMTLRDYFAAKAMQAIMGSDRYIGVVGVNNYAQNASKDAYAMADAMMRAREV